MNKIILKYGLLAGTMMTVYLYLTYSSGFIYRSEMHGYVAYLTILILPICIFLAFKELRKTAPAPKLWNSLLAGTCIALTCASVYSLYVLIDTQFFDMSANREMFEHMEKEMLAAGKSQADIQTTLEKYRAHYRSWKPVSSNFISLLILGGIYSLLFHFLLNIKSKKNNT